MHSKNTYTQRIRDLSLALLCLCILVPPLAADGGVTYQDLVGQVTSGLIYQRSPSPTDIDLDLFKQKVPFLRTDAAVSPIKSRGAPGVALLDHDGDRDLDIYVTNGPGAANSLFSNQLQETGAMGFVDVGAASGAGAVDQDSTGVCFGDIDNDGDEDLYVLGNNEPNRLFENQGDGTFGDITATSGTGAGHFTTTSCSFGDVNGDGLLDLVVANAYTDWNVGLGIVSIPFALNEPNQLFVNQGDNVFSDESAASGLLENRGFAAADEGLPGLTWAIAMVDHDLDGDVDIFMADDQGGVPFAGPNARVRGILHLFENDGSGHFTDISVAAGLDKPGGWMALTFGDLNCDGAMDFFSSNFGDFVARFNSGGQAPVGIFPSRWYLGDGSGGFTQPGLGSLVTTPFGWGAGIFDYDNDGDDDIIYPGGMDLILSVEASNGGVLLQNQGCTATFERDTTAASGTDHLRRTVQGVAIGDLDGNGFEDIVSVSNFDMPAPIPLLSIPNNPTPFTDAGIVPTFAPIGPGEFAFTGIDFVDGTLSVETNSGGNGNHFIQIAPVGTAGITTGGRVNRDGIGAVLTIARHKGPRTVRPIVGGSSYASQHSLLKTFGLGRKSKASVEVLWPGGARNRLDKVKKGERLHLPEIPCSFDDPGLSRSEHSACVNTALAELRHAGVIDGSLEKRLRKSARRAYDEHH